MRRTIILALFAVGFLQGGAIGAQEFLQGEGVILADGRAGCIVQTGEPEADGRYLVVCGKDGFLVAPGGMQSNPDQTLTSSKFVCPGHGKPCYFKP